jgi:hypothetical protein
MKQEIIISLDFEKNEVTLAVDTKQNDYDIGINNFPAAEAMMLGTALLMRYDQLGVKLDNLTDLFENVILPAYNKD